jgi:hypothetical protein
MSLLCNPGPRHGRTKVLRHVAYSLFLYTRFLYPRRVPGSSSRLFGPKPYVQVRPELHPVLPGPAITERGPSGGQQGLELTAIPGPWRGDASCLKSWRHGTAVQPPRQRQTACLPIPDRDIIQIPDKGRQGQCAGTDAIEEFYSYSARGPSSLSIHLRV